jgi:hypothetical protein
MSKRHAAPNQIDLIKAITVHLDRRGFKQANARQFNAIIEAANVIVDAFASPHTPARPGSGLEAWLRSDDTGISSLTMAWKLGPLVGRAVNSPRHGPDHPSDPSDFGRCVGLLEAAPEMRSHLPAMAEVSPVWARLVASWDELEGLYRAELPSGEAPKLFRRMQELIA